MINNIQDMIRQSVQAEREQSPSEEESFAFEQSVASSHRRMQTEFEILECPSYKPSDFSFVYSPRAKMEYLHEQLKVKREEKKSKGRIKVKGINETEGSSIDEFKLP